jgi:uncharacterized OB-fold protein
MDSAFLLPNVEDPDSAGFWAGAAAGELRIQRCAGCGVRRMPPRPMCFACRSLRHGWEPLSGRGTVWSFVVVHPPLLPAYAELAPYNVITVALDEDPTLRLVGNLIATPEAAINSVDAGTIRIGEPVRVVFQVVDDVALPRWLRA